MNAVLQLILRIRLFAGELLRHYTNESIWGSLQQLLLTMRRNERLDVVTEPEAQRNQLPQLLQG